MQWSADILSCVVCLSLVVACFVYTASLAQLVEHALRKRMVVGSIPTGGLFDMVLHVHSGSDRGLGMSPTGIGFVYVPGTMLLLRAGLWKYESRSGGGVAGVAPPQS